MVSFHQNTHTKKIRFNDVKRLEFELPIKYLDKINFLSCCESYKKYFSDPNFSTVVYVPQNML